MGATAVAPRWMRSLLRRYNTFCHELLVQKESIVSAIGEGFGAWARICYRYPYHVMIASLVLCAAMASGLLPPTPIWIDGAEKLYSLPYSRARDDGALHTSYFGDVLGRKSVVILKHKDEGTNILTWKHLEAIQHMDSIIRGREVDPVGSRKLVIPRTFGDQNDNIPSRAAGLRDAENDTRDSSRKSRKDEGGDYPDGNYGGHFSSSSSGPTGMDDRDYMTFEDICLLNPFGECTIDSVLKFGLHEMRQMGLMPNEPEVWVFDGTVYNTKQVGFIPEYYLGGVTKEQCWRKMPLELAKRLLPMSRIRTLADQPGFAMVDIQCITKAQAVMLQYDADGRAQFEDRNMMWERLFIQIMKDNQSFGDLEVSFQAFRSRDDELRASTSESKDVVYVVFTFFILATYSTALNFSCDLYRNKLFSALMGFGAAFMGLGAGMGIVSYMGMPMVPTVLICPFLVLGIGVDDMFVVMNCYCVSYTIHDPEERCVQALRVSGLGISITTLTNLISFGVGSFSAYMSIRNFCVYSAMALLMGYVFVLSFFFPTLCIDARREECARVCPFCLPDVSDRQRVAQERLVEMTEDERKVVESMALLTQEELTAYKVNVFYEEYAIRQAARRGRRAAEKDGTAPHPRPSGHARMQRRLTAMFSAHRPLPPHSSPCEPCEPALASQKRERVSGSSEAGPSFFNQQHSTSAVSTSPMPLAVLSGSASSHASTNRSGKKNPVTDSRSSAVTCGERRLDAERDVEASCSGRAGGEKGDGHTGFCTRLTTTVGDLPPDLAREALYEEPRGNVGRKWREFFLCYYGPFLMWFPVKVVVLIVFAAIAGVSVYGFTKLEMGLELSELAPGNSYMRKFDADFARYFNKFDQPTDIFFVDRKKRPGDSGGSDGVAGGAPLSASPIQPRRLSLPQNLVDLPPSIDLNGSSLPFSSLETIALFSPLSPAVQEINSSNAGVALGTPAETDGATSGLNRARILPAASERAASAASVPPPPTLRGAAASESATSSASPFRPLTAVSGNGMAPRREISDLEVDLFLSREGMAGKNGADTQKNGSSSLIHRVLVDGPGSRILSAPIDQNAQSVDAGSGYSRDLGGEKATSLLFEPSDEPRGADDITVRTEWWNPKVQAAMRAFHKKLESRATTSRLVNPLLTMLDDPQIGAKLRMGDKQIFEDTIYYQLVHAKSPYRQFKFDFIWTGRELKTWRMRLLPKYMATSEERAAWMQQLRDDCDEAARAFTALTEDEMRGGGRGSARSKGEPHFLVSSSTSPSSRETSLGLGDHGGSMKGHSSLPAEPLYPVPYTYMMIFYESDLGILSSVLINMLSAGLAMLLVAFVLIPEALAGLLVIGMICLIDLALFGFMYFWRVKLHMVSTIALVISIGFAVDYSAHLCHTFTHCKGATREKRVIESLVLMGNPVFHGASSTLLGIMLLGFSESFVFTVFFRMMVMVVAFGASHGMILLPVVLSWIGPMGHGGGEESPSLEKSAGPPLAADAERPSSALKDGRGLSAPSAPGSLEHPSADEKGSQRLPSLLTSARSRSESYNPSSADAKFQAVDAALGSRSAAAARLQQTSPRFGYACGAPAGGGARDAGELDGPMLTMADRESQGEFRYVVDAAGNRRWLPHPRAASLPVALPDGRRLASLEPTALGLEDARTRSQPAGVLRCGGLSRAAALSAEGTEDEEGVATIDATRYALEAEDEADEPAGASCISSPLDYSPRQQRERQFKTHRGRRLLGGSTPKHFRISDDRVAPFYRALPHGPASGSSHPHEAHSAERELEARAAQARASAPATLPGPRGLQAPATKSQNSAPGSGPGSAAPRLMSSHADSCPLASRSASQGTRRTTLASARRAATTESRHARRAGDLEKDDRGSSSGTALAARAHMQDPSGCDAAAGGQGPLSTRPAEEGGLSSAGTALPSLPASAAPSSEVSSQPAASTEPPPSASLPCAGASSSVSRTGRRLSESRAPAAASVPLHGGPGPASTSTLLYGGQPVITVRKGIGLVGCPPGGGSQKMAKPRGAGVIAPGGPRAPSFPPQRFPTLYAMRTARPNLLPKRRGSCGDPPTGAASFRDDASERRLAGRSAALGTGGARRSHSTSSVAGQAERKRGMQSDTGADGNLPPDVIHASSLPSTAMHASEGITAHDGVRARKDDSHAALRPQLVTLSGSSASASLLPPPASLSAQSGSSQAPSSPASALSARLSKKIPQPAHPSAASQAAASASLLYRSQSAQAKASMERGAVGGSAAARRCSGGGNLMANRGRPDLGGVAERQAEIAEPRDAGREQKLWRSSSAETHPAP